MPIMTMYVLLKKMKKIILFIFLSGFLLPIVYSQDREHIGGGHFTKRIEYNLKMKGGLANNLNSKGSIEKLFFGDCNAPIEFFYLPSREAAYKETYSCFRIVKKSSNTDYILEVKYILNYVEVQKKFEGKLFYYENGKLVYNEDDAKKINEEQLKLYKVKSKSIRISDQFAEQFYEKMVSLINNFKAKDAPPLIGHGYNVVFRNVVEDEVWTLNIHMPKGDALKISDFCREIITDALASKFDESKYMTFLNTLN